MALNVWQRTIALELPDPTSGNDRVVTVPNAEIEVLVAGTETAADLFSDEAGDTPITNPFNADAEGFARFYVVAGTYDIVATGGGSSITWEDVPLNSPAFTVDDRTALKALPAMAERIALIVNEGSRNGAFIFDTSDLSTEVAADTREGWYVPPNSDATGASGAWVREREVPGEWNARHAGAVADGSTDAQPAIAHAITMAQTFPEHGRVVRIPAKYDAASESGRWYQCDSAISFEPDVIAVRGDGRNITRLRFGSHTNGFQLNNTSSTQNLYSALSGMHIKGSAPDAGVSDTTATVGVRMREFSKGMLRDLYIEDFVDGLEFDADFSGSTTAGLIDVDLDTVYVDQNAWPNQYNSFPRYGARFRNSNGTSNKPQTVRFNGCTIYSQITVKSTTHDGDGVTTDFQLNVGSGTFGLSAARGIQVFVYESGRWVRKTQGTAYDLYDVTGGGATLIAVGADAKAGTMPSTNGYAITDVEVRFSAAPDTGTGNIAITRVDPYGETGLYIEKGSGNSFRGGAIGGYRYAVQLGSGSEDADDNTIDLDYIQLCEVGLKALSGTNTGAKFIVREYSERDILDFTDLGAATGLILDDLAGKVYGDRRTTDLTLTGSYQDALTVTVPNRRPGTHRLIGADVDIEIDETATTRVQVSLSLDYSVDGGNTWTTLQTKVVQSDITGATGNKLWLSAPFRFYHDAEIANPYNVTTDIDYRIQAKLDQGDTGTVNGSASSQAASMQVVVTNP